MAKKKTIESLRPAPAATHDIWQLPKALEYTPKASAERWRVERFDLLSAQFELAPCGSPISWEAAMQSFHEFSAAHSRTSAWFIARRLFGIMPLIPSGDLHPDDLRVNSREEISTALNISAEQIKAELDFLRAGFSEWQKMDGEPGRASHETMIVDPGELALDDQLLKQFGFSERLFKAQIRDVEADKDVPRSEEENKIERDWFCAKLRSPQWQKMLSEPLVSAIARETLVNELYLHRLQQEMMPLSPSSKEFQNLSKTQQQIESQYRGQLEKLGDNFPEMATAGKSSFRGVISDLNLAHRQYYGNKSRKLWDKVHTAAEIVFLMRQSSQLPSARYRLGWTVAVVEAINGLYNPNFRSQLKKSHLKKLDMGFKAGIEAARQELGESLPDLEKGVLPGEGDEFEPLNKPPTLQIEQPGSQGFAEAGWKPLPLTTNA